MIFQYGSRFGRLYYELDEQNLHRIWWSIEDRQINREHPLMTRFWTSWFDNPRTRCPLLLVQSGTPFQKKVWSYLHTIEIGQTKTYGQVAKAIGHKNAQQAVGQACKANRFPLVRPCHRVVGVQNKLTGYAGTELLPLKSLLLNWEQGIGNQP